MTLFKHLMYLLEEAGSCINTKDIKDTWEEQLEFLRGILCNDTVNGVDRTSADWIICLCFAGYANGYITEEEFFELPGVMEAIDSFGYHYDGDRLRGADVDMLDGTINWFYRLCYPTDENKAIEQKLLKHPVVNRFKMQLNTTINQNVHNKP